MATSHEMRQDLLEWSRGSGAGGGRGRTQEAEGEIHTTCQGKMEGLEATLCLFNARRRESVLKETSKSPRLTKFN